MNLSQQKDIFEIRNVQSDKIPEAVKLGAMDQIFNYTIGFVLRDNLLGSGTLTSYEGRYGIITANHVAKEVFAATDGEVAILIAKSPHRRGINPMHFEHLVIGSPEHAGDWKPDLSFICIRDQDLLGTLNSMKSFYDIGPGRNGLAYFDCNRRNEFWWFISGYPSVFRDDKILSTGERIASAKNFIGEAEYLDCYKLDWFDYLKLNLDAGASSFPNCYGGVSGGGIWMVPLVAESDVGVSSPRPYWFLAGVCCYQGALEASHRVIEGHGPNSLYERLRDALEKEAETHASSTRAVSSRPRRAARARTRRPGG
ncbi:MAG TPA: hypothetical protein PKE47_05655 [Verrucomicrobiota bacterium]|nr:hypothetical protein [Verrucomicrobiota bacterium]